MALLIQCLISLSCSALLLLSSQLDNPRRQPQNIVWTHSQTTRTLFGATWNNRR